MQVLVGVSSHKAYLGKAAMERSVSSSRESLGQWEEEHGELWLFPGSPLFP